MLSISPLIQADIPVTDDVSVLQQQVVALQQNFDTFIQQMESILVDMEKEWRDFDAIYKTSGDTTALAHRDVLATKIATLRNSIQQATTQRKIFKNLETKLQH